MRLFMFVFALFALLAFTHIADSACGGGAGRGRARIFSRNSGGGGNSMTRVKIKSRGSRNGGSCGAGGCK